MPSTPAKLSGVCVRCHKPYAPGDPVTWTRRGAIPGKFHWDCRDIPAVQVALPLADAIATMEPPTINEPSATPEPSEGTTEEPSDTPDTMAEEEGSEEPTTEAYTEEGGWPEEEPSEEEGCNCPHHPSCDAYDGNQWAPLLDWEDYDLTEGPCPCPGALMGRLFTNEQAIARFSQVMRAQIFTKELMGLWQAASTIRERVRFATYPMEIKPSFDSYTEGFLDALAVMQNAGLVPHDTMEQEKPTWASLLTQWQGGPA